MQRDLTTVDEFAARLGQDKRTIMRRVRADPRFPRPIYLGLSGKTHPRFITAEVDAFVSSLMRHRQ